MTTTKVCIASSRQGEIGKRCIEFANNNVPYSFEVINQERMDEADIFISLLYDKILSKEYIGGRGVCINFHPGLLPDYRGAGAYSWALINKEKETGITCHVIDHNIDSGPIIAVRRTLIHETDTAETLFDRCMDMIYDLFCETWRNLIVGSYLTQPNDGGHIYLRKDLQDAKDLTHIVKAFTFTGKESAYYYNKVGKKIYLDYEE